MLDPSVLFEYGPDDSYLFDKETLAFALFYVSPFESSEEKLEHLRAIERDLLFEFQPYVDYYPWYYRPIEFKLYEDYEGHSFIYGQLVYGDYINDLWLVTSLLFNFSFRDNNLYIKVFDQDGEFLLIEGFEKIPRWLMNARTSANRIWINCWNIWAIPEDFMKGQSLTMEDSLKFLSKSYYKMENCTDLTDYLSMKIVDKYPKEVLENSFVETVTVSRPVFQFIAENPNYLCNAALNFQMECVFPDGPESQWKFPKSFYKTDDAVDVKVRVSVLAHLYLKQYGQNSELEKGNMLTRSLDKFVSEDDTLKLNWNNSESSVSEYNEEIEKDMLQKELLRYTILRDSIRSKEPDLDKDKNHHEQISVDAEKGKEILRKLQKFMGEDENGNEEADHFVDAEEQFKKDIEREGGNDISEDDFFEFFCKEALHLKDEDLEKVRYDEPEFDDEYDDGDDILSIPPSDNDEIDVLSNLLDSLKAEDGNPGPVSTFLRSLGMDPDTLEK
ncbi:DEKNAAC102247 [Brettanomyces naardenensis]|uniref:DEKNAAC102247 n=1 Tax=Brettanomyces naardenensis TaxID=13370 RepID=A0A448YLA4_BRENA|nr:DEKNAAC102247 [Brettanomyces naardenensis]